MVINFGRELSTFERNLLSYVSYSEGYPSRLIPKTIGVGIEYASYDPESVFAFEGFPNGKGFADADGEGVGGLHGAVLGVVGRQKMTTLMLDFCILY